MTVGKNSAPVLSGLWTKVYEIFGQRRRRFVLFSAVDQLSMSRFILQTLAIKSRSRRKTEQMQKLLALNFFGETTPTFLWHIVIAIYCPQFSKVWLSSVCWCPSGKAGNEVESRIYVEWVKIRVQFEAVSGPKFMTF